MRAGDETEVLGCSGIGWGESQATRTWRQFLRFGSRKIPGSAFPSCLLPCSLQWEGWLPDVPDVPNDSSAFNPERVKRKPCNLWVEKTTAVAFPHPHPHLSFGSYCLGQLLFWLLASQLQETMLWVRKSQRREPIKSLGSGIICFHQAFWSLEPFLARRVAELQQKFLKA